MVLNNFVSCQRSRAQGEHGPLPVTLIGMLNTVKDLSCSRHFLVAREPRLRPQNLRLGGLVRMVSIQRLAVTPTLLDNILLFVAGAYR